MSRGSTGKKMQCQSGDVGGSRVEKTKQIPLWKKQGGARKKVSTEVRTAAGEFRGAMELGGGHYWCSAELVVQLCGLDASTERPDSARLQAQIYAVKDLRVQATRHHISGSQLGRADILKAVWKKWAVHMPDFFWNDANRIWSQV
ncbi:hypothetical protein FGB62_4g122 [Gracilaria domingensis]|nr:hypothetical protein FGB62_4g122 [Gracilaria domingensis]